MAKQLRNLARMLPSQWSTQAIKTVASKLSNFAKLLPLDDKSRNAAVQGEDILNAFMADLFPEGSATDLTSIIDSYDLLLENMPPGQYSPIIVIDEVNALRGWKTSDEEKLTTFLDFLRRICKEKKLAHIVLASSDYFMVSWLSQSMFSVIQRCFSAWIPFLNPEFPFYFQGAWVTPNEKCKSWVI